MFDALLKSKFQTKCKSSIKLTKTRLELIKRKRSATQKYLRKDIADLLKNGLDYIAYGRAEGLLVELNLSSCYEFVEQSCECISNHLSVMSKQRECPEECREAVSSLMFAAARFADLPELRELRSLFTERYENSVESYVNKEFPAKLKAAPSTKDMKLQLMQDIAHEYGIDWIPKALEQKLFKPPAIAKDRSKDNRYKQNNLRETVGGRKQDLSPNGKVEATNNVHQLNMSRKSPGDDIQAKNNRQNVWQSSSDPSTSSSEEEVDDDKRHVSYASIPPPYTRPTVGKCSSRLDVPTIGSVGGLGPTKVNNDLDKEPKAKPRSVRRIRPLKPSPGHDDIGVAKGDDTRKKNTYGNKQDAAKRDGHDKPDEEERVMNQLLMHYSNKLSPNSEPKKRGQEDSLPRRAVSFPVEPLSPIETVAGPARANSFEPDMSKIGHIHPKLPDYDDFVARLAAFRGEGK